MRITIATLAAAVVLSIAAGAAAEKTKDDEAREQFERGVELYDEGKFDQAAISFARAYELKPTYKLLYNIAQTENQLGHYTGALEAYQKYLEDGEDNVDDDRKNQIVSEITRLETLVGTIAVTGDAEGASGASYSFTYSDVQGGPWNPINHNLSEDPLFEGGSPYDLHIQTTSPCADTGTSAGAPSDDMDGNTRPMGTGVDMGAYEVI